MLLKQKQRYHSGIGCFSIDRQFPRAIISDLMSMISVTLHDTVILLSIKTILVPVWNKKKNDDCNEK